MLEWDGSSLEDATFEEVQQIISRPGDRVQLTLFRTRHGYVTVTCHVRPFPTWGYYRSLRDGNVFISVCQSVSLFTWWIYMWPLETLCPCPHLFTWGPLLLPQRPSYWLLDWLFCAFLRLRQHHFVSKVMKWKVFQSSYETWGKGELIWLNNVQKKDLTI